jgi:hypothetical protein
MGLPFGGIGVDFAALQEGAMSELASELILLLFGAAVMAGAALLVFGVLLAVF